MRSRKLAVAIVGCAVLIGASTARAEFQIERVRGLYTLQGPGKSKTKSGRSVQRSSGQRKLSWGSRVQLEQGDFSEASAQLTGHGIEVSLLGGSGVEVARTAPQITRVHGALRVQIAQTSGVQIRLGASGQWAQLTVGQTAGPADWIVFERFAEPQAGAGAKDPELVVVVLKGDLQLSRPERGAGKGRETLALHAGDQYAHSGYSGGDYAPQHLPQGEIAAFYRQWGWEP